MVNRIKRMGFNSGDAPGMNAAIVVLSVPH